MRRRVIARLEPDVSRQQAEAEMTLAGSLLPAMRAARTNPIAAMRAE